MSRSTHPLIGKTVRWAHGPNVLVGPATHYDDEDDELFIVPEGLTHGHYWVPAHECSALLTYPRRLTMPEESMRERVALTVERRRHIADNVAAYARMEGLTGDGALLAAVRMGYEAAIMTVLPLIEEAVTEAVTAERERIIALVRDESPFHDYPDTAAFWRIHDQLADIIAASHRASVTPPTTPTEEER